ncbi:hypothetical protein CR513_46760, partial [Mucuna pruriens]
MLLLQEFDIEIKDKKGAENSVADHLSKIERGSEPMPIRDEFPDKQLLHIKPSTLWFVDICNYVAASQFPLEASRPYKEKLQSDAKYYIWDDPYLWRLCSDKVIRRFGVPKAPISDQGSHFYNRAMASLLHKYGVTNGQAEVFNREIKKTLQKMTNPNRKDWSRLLEDALWAHRTTYRMMLGMSPYRIVFGKTCHILVELEHKTYWAIKQCNLAYDQAGE